MIFHKSDNKILKLGLGLAALGRPGYINLGHGEDLHHDYDEEKMEAQTHAMLDAAYANGVRYFDVAQSYGKAELFLASWLKKHNHPDVVVGSKWGYYYTADWAVDAENHEIKEHTLARLNQQWPESKARLDPYLRIYQIHSATFESGVLENSEVLDRLGEIKAQGYAIGLSVSGESQPAIIEAALKVKVDGKPLFDSVQATYNILEQSCEEALKKAHHLGVTTIIKEGVANGRLTARNRAAHYFQNLANIAGKHKVGVDAIALAYLLSKPFVSMVLSGAATKDHLTSNLQAAEIELDMADILILTNLFMPPKAYWQERGKLAWN
ncbi:MAG: aldo/keto reductase [Cyclobacteriaceae bacterium]